MRVENRESRYTCNIETIYFGETFIYGDEYYILIDDDEWHEGYCKAIKVSNGKVTRFDDEAIVSPVNAKLVIE